VRNSLLLLAVLKVLHMNKQLHLVDVLYNYIQSQFYDECLKFSSFKYFGHSKVSCC